MREAKCVGGGGGGLQPGVHSGQPGLIVGVATSGSQRLPVLPTGAAAQLGTLGPCPLGRGSWPLASTACSSSVGARKASIGHQSAEPVSGWWDGESARSMGHGDCGVKAEEEDEVALPAALQEEAARELREDASVRAHGLQQMRAWLRTHPAIRRCRTDTPFLLRFLRTKKFSVPLAQDMLERYLTVRQLYPHWFRGLDVDDPDLSDILDSGYLIPLPERDEHGRQVLLSCAGRFDPYKYSSGHMARCHSLVVEALMDEPENQIRGYTYLNDESGLLMGHISLWSFTDIRSMLRCIQNSTPMRHKEMHFLHVPHYANKVFEFFTALMNEKLRSRVVFHPSIDDLKETVNPKILPKEYGGFIPMADMIANFKTVLRRKRDVLKSLDDMEIDLNYKTSYITDLEDELSGVAGSFRKLEVD
ncbi:clavesin-2 [Schistocerca cancellata]|uniref:clavesin-2 n=1 Tax=Schistocerca cancellata TaxID=274614 RepID=UPI0021196F95|nr:clavesin-2 [Schistocerca cancellata]